MMSRQGDTNPHRVTGISSDLKYMALELAKLRLGSMEHTKLADLYRRDLGPVALLRVLQLEQEFR